MKNGTRHFSFCIVHFAFPGAMRFDVLTLFPEMFSGYLGQSLLKRAIDAGIVEVQLHNIRDWAQGKHKQVDDRPFGGGPGMVMRPEVVDAALEAATQDDPEGQKAGPAIYLTPRGRRMDQALVRELAAGPGMVLLCGRYEGLDERVIEARNLMEVSLGDIVLSGGEPAALALIDACVRLLPGVMGAAETLEEESFERGLLEYPHYTRPAEWQGRKVPEVLLSGHHEKIKAWRLREAEAATESRRPDLWAAYEKTRPETSRSKRSRRKED
jgi:tRNA (guanine37-N1)-methyltransferase